VTIWVKSIPAGQFLNRRGCIVGVLGVGLIEAAEDMLKLTQGTMVHV
jgi:hypothetical protein